LSAVALLIPACNLTFTTADPVPPSGSQGPFSLQIPIDGNTGVWPTNTQFAWGAYPGALIYKLELSRTSDFSQIVHTVPNIPFTSVFLTVTLTHSTTFYWRVSTVVNSATVYAGGSPFVFTTIPALYGPPDPFLLLSPAGTTVNRVPDPVLTWSYAKEAVTYSVQIDMTSQFLTPVVDLTDLRLSEATCPILLAPNTTYYWRVTASNSGGSRPSSPSFSTFTTGP